MKAGEETEAALVKSGVPLPDRLSLNLWVAVRGAARGRARAKIPPHSTDQKYRGDKGRLGAAVIKSNGLGQRTIFLCATDLSHLMIIEVATIASLSKS